MAKLAGLGGARKAAVLVGYQETPLQPWPDAGTLGVPLGGNPACRGTSGGRWKAVSLAWRIPWMASLVGYSPQGLKELDTTEVT